jgi:predicted ATPase
MTLRRLSVFAGSFALDSVGAVVADRRLTSAAAIQCFESLVAKSLVATESLAQTARFRLLETTRVYGCRMLDDEERGQLCRRHVRYSISLLQSSVDGPNAKLLASVQARNAIDDVSAALEWAFSPRGDPALGINLTLEAIPLWIKMSMVRESHRRVQQAIVLLDRASDAGGTRRELQLLIVLATAMQNGVGPSEENTRLCQRSNKLAETIGDPEISVANFVGTLDRFP